MQRTSDPDHDSFASERDAAIRWARELLRHDNFVVLDTETTGLSLTDEVVQIAVIGPKGQTYLDVLIRPTIPIPPGATAIHGIDNELVKGALTYPWIEGHLHRLVIEREIVVYNASYDYGILRSSSHAHQTSMLLPWDRFRCAMLEYARFVGEWNDYRGSFRWQKLPRLAGDAAHTALGDCRATLALIHLMAESPLREEDTRAANH